MKRPLTTKLFAIALTSAAMVVVCEFGSGSNSGSDAYLNSGSESDSASNSNSSSGDSERFGIQVANAQDQDFFTSSPNPLSREHKSLDSNDRCADCHVGNTKRVDDNKCLNCHDHKNLRARIKSGKGLHATAKVKGQRCHNCHAEHQGRSFNIMGWKGLPPGEKGFDHKLSGWPLKDKHAVLACKNCHKDRNSAGRRTFLGENKLCGSCHRRDQPHRFDRTHNMKCERCHTEISWKPTKKNKSFDHNKKSDAEFPQEGAHKEVACRKCHPKNEFNLKFRNRDRLPQLSQIDAPRPPVRCQKVQLVPLTEAAQVRQVPL